MKTIDLEKYKVAWKRNMSDSIPDNTDSEILSYLKKRSTGITGQFRMGLLFDIVFKSILGISALVLIILFREQSYAMNLSALLLIVTSVGLLFQLYYINMIKGIEKNDLSVKESIQAKISFYNRYYLKSLFIAALSSTLLFINGSMYYFYFEYGKLRGFDLEDVLVFGAFIILSFVISAFAQIWQFNFQIKQLENCLEEINADTIQQIDIENIRRRRRKNILIFSLAFLLGLLVLLYFVIK